MKIVCGKRLLDLSEPKVMGVLNVTPDSFSDGGCCHKAGRLQLDMVLSRVQLMLEQGAEIIDVGGESTRPGATPVSKQEECDRVLPVVAAICNRFDTLVSIDTSTPELMLEASALGAGMINDVRALQQPGAIEAAAKSGLAVCLMHMQGGPQTMQVDPCYKDTLIDVYQFLSNRQQACLEHGICSESIIFDPGIGFGKKDEHNLELLKNLNEFSKLGPVLLGVSRKSMFGRLLGRDLGQRLAGSLAVAMLAVQKGVKIIRVHDVAETTDVLRMLKLISR